MSAALDPTYTKRKPRVTHTHTRTICTSHDDVEAVADGHRDHELTCPNHLPHDTTRHGDSPPSPPLPQKYLDDLFRVALKKCDTQAKTFAACAKEQGMLVVFRCREQNKALQSCLAQYTNEEKQKEWLQMTEIERAGKELEAPTCSQ